MPAGEAEALLVEQIAGAIAGGIDVIQLREPDLAGRDYVRLARRAMALSASTPSRVVVNDRADVAVAAAARGVHLRESSVAVAELRKLVPEAMLVGRSVHTIDGVRNAGRADYLIAGTVFPTASKPGLTRALGVEGLAAMVAAAGECPIWAVGGVTLENVSAVKRTGARGIAAIAGFIPGGEATALRSSTERLTKLWRFSLTGL